MKTIHDTLFVNSTREMVSLSFELDKEGSGIIFFFFLLRSWQIEILLALFLYRAKKLTISLILFTNKTLSTSLILAICRTGLIYELRKLRTCSPRILCGSVVEHQSAESEDLGSIPHGDSELFLCHKLVTRRKTSLSKIQAVLLNSLFDSFWPLTL